MTATTEAPASRLPNTAFTLSLVSAGLCTLCMVGSSIRNAADRAALLGIVTLVPLLSLVAIVTGIVALRRSQRGKRGWKLSLAAIVFGALSLAVCAATFWAMWSYASSFLSH